MTVPTPATPQVHAEEDVDRYDAGYRTWLAEALAKVQADANRSSDTHLLAVPLPEQWGVDLYLKDESTHPTGSLKHRLARSLFLHALCNGWIRPGKPVIEASSGSTAISEAYFARLIGVPFIAVMARSTSQQKVQLIEFYGGRCHLVDDPSTIYEESRRLAAETPLPVATFSTLAASCSITAAASVAPMASATHATRRRTATSTLMSLPFSRLPTVSGLWRMHSEATAKDGPVSRRASASTRRRRSGTRRACRPCP